MPILELFLLSLKRIPALAGVTQLVGTSSDRPKGRRFDPRSGHAGEGTPLMFLSHIDVSLLLSLTAMNNVLE